MYHKAETMYYTLATFVVGATFFVVQPANSPEMSQWQDGMKLQFTNAWVQTLGDQPWFTEFALIYEGVSGFYEHATDATIALINQPEADEDVIYVFNQVYNIFANAINSNSDTIAYSELPLPPITDEFMTEEPLYNIVPYRMVVKTIEDGTVAGVSLDNSVVNDNQPWVTIKDNLTNQLYCLAIYNGTVNKYLGSCKYDYY